MTLSEWTSLPKARQRELVIGLYESGLWSDYERLAMEAADALKKKLVAVPEVLGVEAGHGEVIHVDKEIVYVRELLVNVYTRLAQSEKLEHLPSRFAGFDVHQLNLGD